MSDVYQSEINPDDEPGERLKEALRGADARHADRRQETRDVPHDRRHKERRRPRL